MAEDLTELRELLTKAITEIQTRDEEIVRLKAKISQLQLEKPKPLEEYGRHFRHLTVNEKVAYITMLGMKYALDHIDVVAVHKSDMPSRVDVQVAETYDGYILFHARAT